MLLYVYPPDTVSWCIICCRAYTTGDVEAGAMGDIVYLEALVGSMGWMCRMRRSFLHTLWNVLWSIAGWCCARQSLLVIPLRLCILYVSQCYVLWSMAGWCSSFTSCHSFKALYLICVSMLCAVVYSWLVLCLSFTSCHSFTALYLICVSMLCAVVYSWLVLVIRLLKFLYGFVSYMCLNAMCCGL